MGIALHEAGHFVRESNPLEWKAISDYVVNYLTKKGKNVEKMVADVKALYKEKAPSDEAALEEVVCNSLTAIASDPNATAYVVGDKTTLQRIADGLRKIAAKIKELIGSFGNTFDSAKAFMKDAAALNELAEMFSAAAENGKRYVQENEAYINGSEVDFSKDAAETEQKENARTENNSEQKNNTHKGAKVKYSIEYQNETENKDILSLIKKVKSGNYKDNEKVYFENISKENAEKIHKLTDIDVTGFRVAIEARRLSHILKDHGNNGLTDHSMANDIDISKMQYALKYPNNISFGGKTEAYSTYKNGYNKTADTVLYEKFLGNKSYYVVQAVPNTKAKTLYIVTAFIGKQGYKIRGPQLIDTKSPNVTSKHGSGDSSTGIVSSNNVDVNNNFAKNNTNGKNSFDETTPDIRYAIDDKVKDLEAELNNAGLYLQSKDNNKNNLRIKKYIAEKYPDLKERVVFEVNKQSGTVSVTKIKTQKDIDNEAKRQNEYAENNRRKMEEEKFYQRIKTYSGVNLLIDSLNNHFAKDNIDAEIRFSKSIVRTISFYVDYTNANGDLQTIKVSDHFTENQRLEHPDEEFINLKHCVSFGDVYSKIMGVYRAFLQKMYLCIRVLCTANRRLKNLRFEFLFIFLFFFKAFFVKRGVEGVEVLFVKFVGEKP